MSANLPLTRRLLVVCHHRDRQTAHFEGAKSCVHYYRQKCHRRRRTKAEARARAASPQSSNPFSDALPYPTILPSRKEWKKTFTTNDGVKYTCRACDVDDIPAVASLLMRSKLAGFPTEERELKKYIEKSIDAFPRGAYIVLVKEDDEEEEKSVFSLHRIQRERITAKGIEFGSDDTVKRAHRRREVISRRKSRRKYGKISRAV